MVCALFCVRRTLVCRGLLSSIAILFDRLNVHHDKLKFVGHRTKAQERQLVCLRPKAKRECSTLIEVRLIVIKSKNYALVTILHPNSSRRSR